MSLLEPIEQIILKHHGYLRRVLPEIMQKVIKINGCLGSPESKDLLKSLGLLNEELHKHLLKEEVLLFPAILEVERAAFSGAQLDLTRHDIQNPLEQMEFEHDVTEKFLAEIHGVGEKLNWKKDFSELYQSICNLETDLLCHIQLEEENLFKEARKFYIQAMSRRTSS